MNSKSRKNQDKNRTNKSKKNESNRSFKIASSDATPTSKEMKSRDEKNIKNHQTFF